MKHGTSAAASDPSARGKIKKRIMPAASCNFIATGGNRHPATADWDAASGIVAYGADRNVALWRPDDLDCGGVRALLYGHNDSVNVVRFLRTSSRRSVLLTGSVNGTVRVWVTDRGSENGFREAQIVRGHTRSINAIAVLPRANVAATASADGGLKIWRIEGVLDGEEGPGMTPLQEINLDPHYIPLTLDIAYLESEAAVCLAVAGTRSFIQIFVAPSSLGKFSIAAALTGHEGWIRSLSFVHENDQPHGDLLLASASQDKYIRLWRLHEGKDIPAVSRASRDPLLGSIKNTLSNKAHRFSCNNKEYSITFEALLIGHEDWIYTAKWSMSRGRLRLLSASADNSVAIWELDTRSGVWICDIRLGEINAQKGATTATGSSGGLWTALWSPDGNAIASVGRTGGWRLWRRDEPSDNWTQDFAVTGHVRAVRDLAWARDGSYLLSTAADQTTRLFAEWKRQERTSWHEMSRPQIHGYDLNCVDVIKNSRFISGADEKPLRVFDMPKATAELLATLSGSKMPTSFELPDAANIPVMGLSNKAIEVEEGNNANSNENGEKKLEEICNVELNGTTEIPQNERHPHSSSSSSAIQTKPPSEDQLGRHLLWPEKEKLYGHGYEICAVASSKDSTLLATACKATSVEHAVIRGYKTRDWQQFRQALRAHSLTVTRLEFSEDDAYLLSVGRDRQCFLFKRDGVNPNHYSMSASDPKAHSRMILDASWAPVQAGKRHVFATAGRDKNIHIWTPANDATLEKHSTINTASPATAIAFVPLLIRDYYNLAFGLEDGSVGSVKIPLQTLEADDECFYLPSTITPSRAVTALTWRPGRSSGEQVQQLAAASEDCSVIIYDFDLST